MERTLEGVLCQFLAEESQWRNRLLQPGKEAPLPGYEEAWAAAREGLKEAFLRTVWDHPDRPYVWIHQDPDPAWLPPDPPDPTYSAYTSASTFREAEELGIPTDVGAISIPAVRRCLQDGIPLAPIPILRANPEVRELYSRYAYELDRPGRSWHHRQFLREQAEAELVRYTPPPATTAPPTAFGATLRKALEGEGGKRR